MSLRAGIGKAVITPPLPVKLSGYYPRRGAANEVHDDLEVRALVLTNGDTTLCLLVCDLLGMTQDYTDPIRDKVAAELGVPRGAVVTSCDHPHSGPSTLTGSEFLGWTTPEGYRDLLIERCLEAAIAAHDAATDAELRFARVPVPQAFFENRRKNPFAPTAAVLDIVRPDGERVGTVANFGCHPVVLGPKNVAVSTDWIGPFRAALEEQLGGTAIFLQGCQGDVNPQDAAWEVSTPEEWFPIAEREGRRFAQPILEAVEQAVPVGDELVVSGERTVAIEVTHTPLAALGRSGRRVDVDLIEWTIGGVTLITVPGEGMHGLERRVLAARGDETLLAGLAPAWQGYLPVPFTRGYEEGLSFGRKGVAAIVAALEAGPTVAVRDVGVNGLTRGLGVAVDRVDTTRGRIEVARTGSGPYVMMIHGTPGSWRQGVPLAHLMEDEFTVLLPSRPGYGKTPISAGRTPAEQAAAYAALLDAWGIDRVAMIGVSGGAPSAAAFAQHFPERASSLILMCPLAAHLMKIPTNLRLILHTPIVANLYAAVDRYVARRKLAQPGAVEKSIANELSEKEQAILASDPELREALTFFAYSHLDAPVGLDGLKADGENVTLSRRFGPMALDRIKAPTLVMHGTADKTVLPAQGQFYVDGITGARLEPYEGFGHLFPITQRHELLEQVKAHLQTSA